MTRPSTIGAGDYRGPIRHESLTPTHHEQDHDSAWMIGYLDVMTLLVALMVLIFTLTYSAGGVGEAASDVDGSAAISPMGVPLPVALERTLSTRPVAQPVSRTPRDGQVSRAAVVAALGVAGLPPRSRSAHVPPPLLARPGSQSSMPPPAVEPPAPTLPLPQPLLSVDGELAPLADYMLVLTDHPPTGMREVDQAAVTGALALNEALSERVREAPYLPDLEGVEVSRVREGIKLRVEDQWLFPTAAAELTEEGRQLVERMVAIIQRHDGEVAVEGHTDDRSIQTDEFPSNWVLSSARAIAIVHALEAAGVASQRLRAVGLADTRPLAGNDTAQGREQNRRVEVIIHADPGQ